MKADFFCRILDSRDPLLAWLGFLVENHINRDPTFHAQCKLKLGCIFFVERIANMLETCRSTLSICSFRFQDAVCLQHKVVAGIHLCFYHRQGGRVQ